MKQRYGFVSNSSSASFLVWKKDITPEEISKLLEYNLSDKNVDGWTITETKDTVTGFTLMDNDALDEYLEEIAFNVSKMEWHAEY